MSLSVAAVEQKGIRWEGCSLCPQDAFLGAKGQRAEKKQHLGAVLSPRCTPIRILLCRVKGNMRVRLSPRHLPGLRWGHQCPPAGQRLPFLLATCTSHASETQATHKRDRRAASRQLVPPRVGAAAPSTLGLPLLCGSTYLLPALPRRGTGCHGVGASTAAVPRLQTRSCHGEVSRKARRQSRQIWRYNLEAPEADNNNNNKHLKINF